MRLLFFSTHQTQVQLIHTNFSKNGFALDCVFNKLHLHHAIQIQKYRLLILDVMKDPTSYLKIIKNIRGDDYQLPIIVMNCTSQAQEKIAFLDAGADDCMPAPLNPEELFAKVKAMTRRNTSNINSTIRHGDIILDTDKKTVMFKETHVNLTRREFFLLQTLLENRGKPNRRDDLENMLYAWNEEIESNTLVVHIYRLRKKLGNSFIKTVRGFGYMVES